MNDDKLREWIDRQLPHIEYSAKANAVVQYDAQRFLDLITAYRQLEKDNKADMKQITDLIGYGVYYQEANAELLAALWEIEKHAITAHLEIDGDAKGLALDSIRLIKDLAHQTRTKFREKYPNNKTNGEK